MDLNRTTATISMAGIALILSFIGIFAFIVARIRSGLCVEYNSEVMSKEDAARLQARRNDELVAIVIICGVVVVISLTVGMMLLSSSELREGSKQYVRDFVDGEGFFSASDFSTKPQPSPSMPMRSDVAREEEPMEAKVPRRTREPPVRTRARMPTPMESESSTEPPMEPPMEPPVSKQSSQTQTPAPSEPNDVDDENVQRLMSDLEKARYKARVKKTQDDTKKKLDNAENKARRDFRVGVAQMEIDFYRGKRNNLGDGQKEFNRAKAEAIMRNKMKMPPKRDFKSLFNEKPEEDDPWNIRAY